MVDPLAEDFDDDPGERPALRRRDRLQFLLDVGRQANGSREFVSQLIAPEIKETGRLLRGEGVRPVPAWWANTLRGSRYHYERGVVNSETAPGCGAVW